MLAVALPRSAVYLVLGKPALRHTVRRIAYNLLIINTSMAALSSPNRTRNLILGMTDVKPSNMSEEAIQATTTRDYFPPKIQRRTGTERGRHRDTTPSTRLHDTRTWSQDQQPVVAAATAQLPPSSQATTALAVCLPRSLIMCTASLHRKAETKGPAAHGKCPWRRSESRCRAGGMSKV